MLEGGAGVANHSPDSEHDTLPNKVIQAANLPNPGATVDTTLHTHEDLSVDRTYASGKYLSIR